MENEYSSWKLGDLMRKIISYERVFHSSEFQKIKDNIASPSSGTLEDELEKMYDALNQIHLKLTKGEN